MLGLAQRAGRLVSGFDAVKRAIVRGRAHLIVISQDASANTAERVRRIAAARGVPCVAWADMRTLGAAIGRRDRAVIAVVDPQMAEAVRKALAHGESGKLG